jgi:DNA invertase Pin-like site-specific DNA recombinase
MKKMKVLYTRVSTLDQKTDRQKINEKDYHLVVEDKCSGAIPFNERTGGKEVLKLVEKGVLTELFVWQIDRLGRDVRDILNTIHFFNQNGICIHFVSQSLRTLTENGKEDPITKMIISVLGIVSEMERNQIKERQMEGVKIAKMKGVYLGRKPGSSEDNFQFLNKGKNQKALSYLKKGYKAVEVSKIVGLHINTITKIKKIGLGV